MAETPAATAYAATHVPVSRIVDALRDAAQLRHLVGALPASITDLVDDSRRVGAGSAFLAVKGAAQDGHTWLPKAQELGAVLAIVEDEDAALAAGLPAIVVHDGRRSAAVAAAAFHDWPARSLTLAAVTGTNGKTTTVGLLRHLLDGGGATSASIGTLGVLIGSSGTEMPGGSGLTTPGPVELQRVLRALVDRGVTHVAMETSSHALHQHRVDGVQFAAAVFTNLTRDHLDYHGTMDAYRDAKLELLPLLAADGTACFNIDDPTWRDAVATGGVAAGSRHVTFSGTHDADIAAQDVSFDATGSHFVLTVRDDTGMTRHEVSLPLIGDFNVANALGAAAAAIAMGLPAQQVATALSRAPQVPGRLERLRTEPTVLRDYAHTPDALERALQAVRPFTLRPDGAPSRLIVVFGCGGDRDRGKRPVMGGIAEQLADVTIVTSDNPRTEDPERILDDIEAGMTRRDHRRIVDRREAIAEALRIASAHDVVVLAGKGHETYQIRGTTSYPFDERTIVKELWEAMTAEEGTS
ncbi:UDP-N-acetylmuramoyl-L-alanyl-D-glutamate--2,6-diaminopimelate ligase [Gemmatimonas sp.]|uniref:UDP-N-acetylmuramoyl-L-alanyl-D-glutamate--2, 6-diaminopimelate ligase n=1 Tax=Gemmatimonas sp. TaxID=1962908 RepID=UPI002EDB99D5